LPAVRRGDHPVHYKRATWNRYSLVLLLEGPPYAFVTWKPAAVRPNPAGMRFYFHIVDKYGLSPDGTGCEQTDQDAAVMHARRIAAELAKAGEFFRSSIVLVAAVPGPASSPDQGATVPTAKA
jgi:hypothetical protein